MISERKKYDKLANHIYAKYTMKHELRFTLKVIILVGFFCIFLVNGYVFYFLKNYGFNLREFIERVPIAFIVSTFIFAFTLLVTLIGNLLYVKFRFDDETRQEDFDRFLRSEFKLLYSKGEVEKYEIFRFYLLDSLDLYGLDIEEYEVDLDRTPKKPKQKQVNKSKPNNSNRNRQNKSNEFKENKASNPRVNARNRAQYRR